VDALVVPEQDQDAMLRDMKSEYQHGFNDEMEEAFRVPMGLNREVIEAISRYKNEPDWALQFRLKSLEKFLGRPMPQWGPDFFRTLDFQNLTYFIVPELEVTTNWDDIPDKVKQTFERLGVPRAEAEYLAGSASQYDSLVAYHKLNEELSKQGVIFLGMDEAIEQHPELVRKYLGTVVPPGDNFASALNSAAFSGGSFVYVPEGVQVELPLSAYFRINSSAVFQGERTLIIAEKGSRVSYAEGCSAPSYVAQQSIHAAVVEIVVKDNAEVHYYTVQNWSPESVYNLVVKRAVAYENANMHFTSVELGSCGNAKFPCVVLKGRGGHAEITSVAYADTGQIQDTGGKLIMTAPDTSGTIISKSISKNDGISTYRGLVKIGKNAKNAKVKVVCDALLLDENSVTNTYPTMEIGNDEVEIEHEATVSKVGEEQLFYLMSRGIPEDEAMAMIVNGFIEPVVKELPMEYAVEISRLMELQMEGSVG
jgi:Fe-S cluster assembly protein SufB